MDEYLQSNDLEKLHEENVNRWIGGIHLQQSERAEDLLEYLTNIRFAQYALYYKLNNAACNVLANDTNINHPTFDTYNELKLRLKQIKDIL